MLKEKRKTMKTMIMKMMMTTEKKMMKTRKMMINEIFYSKMCTFNYFGGKINTLIV